MTINYIAAMALSALLTGIPSQNGSNMLFPDRENQPKEAAGNLCGGGYLGVMIDDVDKAAAESLKLPEERGAKITKVLPESPAAKAGLQENDVVVKWNGSPVEGSMQLVRLVGETPAGRNVTLTVIRNGQPVEVKAEIGKRKMEAFHIEFDGDDTALPPGSMNEEKIRKMEIEVNAETEESMKEMEQELKEMDKNLKDMNKDLPKQMEDMKKNLNENRILIRKMHPQMGALMNGSSNINILMNTSRFGATMQNTTPQLAKFFGVPNDKTGVLIGDVPENTPAAKAGLKAGDVIIGIAGETVESPMDAMKIIEKKEGTVPVKIIRDKAEQTINVDLGKRDAKSEGDGKNGSFFFNFNGGGQPMGGVINTDASSGDCKVKSRIIIRGLPSKSSVKAPKAPVVPVPPVPPATNPSKDPTML